MDQKSPIFWVGRMYMDFWILGILIFDSFDELESIRLTLIWIELDWISNWTKIPKSLCWPNACNALMSWCFWFCDIGCVWNHLGWWFDVDCRFDWIETESDTKSLFWPRLKSMSMGLIFHIVCLTCDNEFSMINWSNIVF